MSPLFPDLARPTLAAALERYKTLRVWNRTPMLQPEGSAWIDAACRSGGYIQYSVPYDQCVDMRLAAQVVQETPPVFDDDTQHETPKQGRMEEVHLG
jgi:hypothetical protein